MAHIDAQQYQCNALKMSAEHDDTNLTFIIYFVLHVSTLYSYKSFVVKKSKNCYLVHL